VGKKKSTRVAEGKEAEGGRRGGKKADKTFEKEETTKARGKGEASLKGVKDADKAGSGGRRSKKTESTAAEQDTE
jgi:hypothetical protein